MFSLYLPQPPEYVSLRHTAVIVTMLIVAILMKLPSCAYCQLQRDMEIAMRASADTFTGHISRHMMPPCHRLFIKYIRSSFAY